MLIKKLILSKKSQSIYNKTSVYSFDVDCSANKFQIKKAIEDMFQVKVKKVRTSRQSSVLQRTRYLQKFPGKIYTKELKKAFIKLVKGQKLPNLNYY